jgi:hypothetical protein
MLPWRPLCDGTINLKTAWATSDLSLFLHPGKG